MRQPHGGHGYPAWLRGTVLDVPLTAVRDELVVALEETLQLARRLAADARDGEVSVAELVAQDGVARNVAYRIAHETGGEDEEDT